MHTSVSCSPSCASKERARGAKCQGRDRIAEGLIGAGEGEGSAVQEGTGKQRYKKRAGNISSNKEGKRSAIRRQTSGRRSLPEVKKGTVNSCQDLKRRWFVSVQPITAPCARLKQRHDWSSASPQLLQMMRMPGGARWSLGASTPMLQKLVRLSLPARAP